MNEVENIKLNKVNRRIIEIETHLEHHYKNVKQLEYNFKNQSLKINRGIKYVNQFSYHVIPFSQNRFASTLNNLKTQIFLLEFELKILVDYCKGKK